MAEWKALGLGVAAGLAAAGAVALGWKLLKPRVGRGGGGGGRWRLGKSYHIKDQLSLYINGQNSGNEVLGRLREVSVQHSHGGMTTGVDVDKLLTALTRSLGAKKVIDVGVFTGCSSFAMALSLPDGGKVVACDVSADYANIGRPFWIEGGVADKIDLRVRPATETLQELLDGGEAGTYDLVFIDADKFNYTRYYEFAVQLLRQGGLVVVDNALWDGAVADPSIQDANTNGIREVNSRMKTDSRVDYVLLAVSDGIGIACKH